MNTTSRTSSQGLPRLFFGSSEHANFNNLVCNFDYSYTPSSINNSSNSVSGDHFWMAYLTANDVNGRGLPQVTFVIGFNGGHLPFAVATLSLFGN